MTSHSAAVESVPSTLDVPSHGDVSVPSGTKIGRYVVIEEVGHGAMGRVYRAVDPRLDRSVAVKVLRGTLDARAHARAIREGRALARLSHPNVVQVFDVGMLDSSLFLAMEYVDGSTLRGWGQERPWTEVLDAYLQAGRGLAAAHAAGLIHRDFKPSNVLMGRDGRARVGDFGLVRGESDKSASGGLMTASDLSEELTWDGAVVGTPVYMSPEQHIGDPVDARSDQYAFCVALFEALYGVRPFGEHKTPQHLFRAKFKAAPPLPEDAAVPVTIGNVVCRGLSPRAEDRWPSMSALLEQLDNASSRPTPRWPLLVAGGAIITSAVWFAGGDDAGPDCEAGADAAQRSWTAERREAVLRAFEDSKRSYARQAWTFAGPKLDEFAERWGHTRLGVCRAEQSEDRDRQLACLDRLRHRFSAVADWVAEAPDDAAEGIAEVVAELGDPRACLTNPRFDDGLEGPADLEGFVEFQRLYEEGRTLVAAGKAEVGIERLRRALLRATELHYAPAVIQTERLLGESWVGQGEIPRGVSLLQSAYHEAVSIGFDREAAEAAIQMVGASTKQGDFDAARRWSDHARAATQRVGSRNLEADLEGHVAYLEGQLGNVELQVKGAERALELRREAAGDVDTAPVAAELSNLGVAYRVAGRYEASRKILEEGIAVKERISGPGHPITGQIYNQLGVTCRHLGDYETSKRHFKSAIRVFEAAGGPEHPNLSFVRNNYMLLLRTMEEYEEAEHQVRLALAQERKIRGPEHPAVAAMMANLAIALHDLERNEEARDVMLQVLRSHENNFGSEHPAIAAAHANLGLFLSDLGDTTGARKHLEAAIPIYEATLGESHARVAIALNNLGDLAFEQGDIAEAETVHRRALSIRSAAYGEDHADTATSMKNLADVLVAKGDYERARELYEQSLAIRERDLGPEHDRVTSTRSALERLRAKMGG